MRTSAIIAIVVTIILVVLVGIFTAMFGWVMWAVALNGFTGHAYAIEVSMGVYFVGTILCTVVIAILSAMFTRRLSVTREWNALGASALSTAIASVVIVIANLVVLAVSVAVAGALYKVR